MKYQNVKSSSRHLIFVLQECFSKEELKSIFNLDTILPRDYSTSREIITRDKSRLVGFHNGYFYVIYPPLLKKYEIYYSKKDLIRECILKDSKSFFDSLMFCHSSDEMKSFCSNLTDTAYRNLSEKYDLKIYCDNYEFTRTKNNPQAPKATIRFRQANYLHGDVLGCNQVFTYTRTFCFSSKLKSLKRISENIDKFLTQLER